MRHFKAGLEDWLICDVGIYVTVKNKNASFGRRMVKLWIEGVWWSIKESDQIKWSTYSAKSALHFSLDWPKLAAFI